jgi:hypothetical protein
MASDLYELALGDLFVVVEYLALLRIPRSIVAVQTSGSYPGQAEE